MSAPIALGRTAMSPSTPLSTKVSDFRHFDKPSDGKITPDKRMPVIDRSKVDPQTLAAAEGMEAMFLDYLMKTMRETVPKNDMDLDNPAAKIYTGMLDSEMAQKAAKQGGVGLAEQIIAYLDSQRYTLEREQAVPKLQGSTSSVSTGGIHEGYSNRK